MMVETKLYRGKVRVRLVFDPMEFGTFTAMLEYVGREHKDYLIGKLATELRQSLRKQSQEQK